MKTQFNTPYTTKKDKIMKTSKDSFLAFSLLFVLFIAVYTLIAIIDKFDISKGELIAGFFYISFFSLLIMFFINSAYNVKR